MVLASFIRRRGYGHRVPIVSKIPAALAPSLATTFRESGVAEEEARGTDPIWKGNYKGSKIQVRKDGTIIHRDDPSTLAFVAQGIRGLLPRAPKRFLLGVDEAGIGGEGRPSIAIVIIPAEVRAELIAHGVRDSKTISSPWEIDRLAKIVSDHAVLHIDREVSEPEKGQSFAACVARVIAELLRELFETGDLNERVFLRIDQTDERVLQEELGDIAHFLRDRMEIQKESESHVEVASASIMASLAASRNASPKKVVKKASMRLEGSFALRLAKEEDRDQVLRAVEDLQPSYPAIARWIGREGSTTKLWKKITDGTYRCIVAKAGNDLAGFSISQQKDNRNVKLSTFEVLPRFRGKKIGERLLRKEMVHWVRQRVRRIFVTFGHEQFENMEPFMRRHGFTVDGISPQRYRDTSYEVVMGKRFCHDKVDASDFPEFAELHLFRATGYEIERLDPQTFIAKPRHTLFTVLPQAQQDRFLVKSTTVPDPESIVPGLRKSAKKHDARPVLVSLNGWPAIDALPNGVTVLDAYEISKLLDPVHLEQEHTPDLIIPIKPGFVRRIMPDEQQATLTPLPRGLRTDNVYYRIAKGGMEMRRGARLFFYESEGAGIRGSGRLQQIDKGSAAKLFSRYGGQGAWNQREVETHLRGREGMVYRFDWFQRFPVPVPIREIQNLVPKFNPQTVYGIPHKVGDKITALGGPR